MHPIFTELSLFGFTRPIGTYGLMMAFAILSGGIVAVRAAHRAGIDPGDAIAAAGFVAAGGLFGAWLMQIVVETLRTGSLTVAIARGGLVFYGAPIFGTLALALACRPLGIPFGRLVDVAIPAIPIAHAFGRFGCFFAGCCYGDETGAPIGVRFDHPLAADPSSLLRHPVQLYEAFGLLAIALFLLVRPPARVGDGHRALGYVIAYAVLRTLVERFRGDVDRGLVFGVISTADLVSLVLVVFAVVVLSRTRREARV